MMKGERKEKKFIVKKKLKKEMVKEIIRKEILFEEEQKVDE